MLARIPLLSALLLVIPVFLPAQQNPGEQAFQSGQEALRKKEFGDAELFFRQSVRETESASASNPSTLAQALVWLEVALKGKSETWSEDHTSEIQQLSQRIAGIAAVADTSVRALSLEVYALALEFAKRTEEAKPIWEQAKVLRVRQIESLQQGEAPIEGLVSIGGGVKPPSVKKKVDPSYTEESRVLKRSGTILCKIIVDQNGKASHFQLIRSLGFGLDEEAYRTIKQWEFAPATNGDSTPVPTHATIEINFRLL